MLAGSVACNLVLQGAVGPFAVWQFIGSGPVTDAAIVNEILMLLFSVGPQGTKN